MFTRSDVIHAIGAAWAADTAEVSGQWQPSNPAQGHCDVSSFVAWEHLGGDLVLGEVHLDGEFQEYHYWNRIDGVDLDLTGDQFRNGEVVTEKSVLDSATLEAKRHEMRPDLVARIDTFRVRVCEQLAAASVPDSAA